MSTGQYVEDAAIRMAAADGLGDVHTVARWFRAEGTWNREIFRWRRLATAALAIAPTPGKETTHRLWVNGHALDAVYKDGRYHVIEELIGDPFSNTITSDFTDEQVEAAAKAISVVVCMADDDSGWMTVFSADSRQLFFSAARAGLTAVLGGDRS